jgi:hypothetical protein
MWTTEMLTDRPEGFRCGSAATTISLRCFVPDRPNTLRSSQIAISRSTAFCTCKWP